MARASTRGYRLLQPACDAAMINEPKIRVVLADDHAVLRAGLKALLNVEPDIEVVGEAEDGAAAVEAARDVQPDVIVMDIQMPRMGGLEATRVIRQSGLASKVLILT